MPETAPSTTTQDELQVLFTLQGRYLRGPQTETAQDRRARLQKLERVQRLMSRAQTPIEPPEQPVIPLSPRERLEAAYLEHEEVLARSLRFNTKSPATLGELAEANAQLVQANADYVAHEAAQLNGEPG